MERVVSREYNYSAPFIAPGLRGKMTRRGARLWVPIERRPLLHRMQMASTRAASEHMAGRSRVRVRWHRSTGEGIGTRDQAIRVEDDVC